MSAIDHPDFVRARPYLIAALERGDHGYTLMDVVELLDNNSAILWSGKRSAMVTTVDPCDCCGRLVITVWCGGGDMKELLRDGMPHAEQWALDAGCVRAEINPGRHGWARILRRYGWRDDDGLLIKDLLP